ncbi:DUF2461 family protein [Paenibacillus cisolokensis]|uniref:DUF2461 family protein n=1 Tax=Paenibacillus cisolokensis TaxID=1658519 RepID=UPI0035562600
MEFLIDLKANNTKSWFEDHKRAYTEYVMKPAQSLVSELSDFILAIDPYLETSSAVGKTISRIYQGFDQLKDLYHYLYKIKSM